MVVEDFSLDGPKTKEIATVLKALALNGKKTLFLTGKTDRALFKSGRNIAKLNVREADKASTFDILNNQVLLIQKSAVEVLHNSLKN